MSKFERLMETECQAVASELGIVGEFQLNNPHNVFRLVLPDQSVIKVSLPTTPRSKWVAQRTVKKRIRRVIMDALRQRGVKGVG